MKVDTSKERTVSTQVEFLRTGGFAGIDMTAKVLAQELPADQANVVSGLLSSNAAPKAAAGAAVPDGFGYLLTIQDGGQRRTFSWDEAQLPEDVRPLIDNLSGLARPV